MAPEPDAPLGRRAIRSVGWVALDKWGARLTSLVVFGILGRLLAPADFGVIALATVFIAFLSVLVDVGFSQALVQRENLDDAHTHTAFWISLGLGVGLGLALFLAATTAGALGSDSVLVPVLQVLSLALPLGALSSVPAALLTREFGFRALAIRRLVATAVGAVVAVWLAASGAGVWALVAQALATSAVGVLVLWRVTPWRPSRRFSRQAASDLMTFGVAVLGIEMIAQANAHVDKLLVGLFLGPASPPQPPSPANLVGSSCADAPGPAPRAPLHRRRRPPASPPVGQGDRERPQGHASAPARRIRAGWSTVGPVHVHVRRVPGTVRSRRCELLPNRQRG